MDTIQGLIVDDLLELNTAAIVANPELTIVSRSDVGQGDLAKVRTCARAIIFTAIFMIPN